MYTQIKQTMIIFRYCQQAYIAASLSFRVSLILMGIGVNVCWYGKTWLTETSDGGTFLSSSLRSVGVIGIKLGQYCSQRPDIFSDTCRLELSRLTDRNQPVPWTKLHTQCEIDNISLVDSCPLGTGSLAQVHPIEWQTKASVLKILLPDYEKTRFELQCCRFFLESLQYIGVLPIKWDTFMDATERQLDMRNEAEELVYAHTLFGGTEGLVLGGTRIRVPELFCQSRLCIVMERATGKSLHSLRNNVEVTQIANRARKAALVYMTTSGDRRFHADLHDGNVLFDNDSNTLWLIHFGLCSHPPQGWTSPLSSILRYAADNTCRNAARDMVSSIFSISEAEAIELMPVFHEIFGQTANPSISESTRAFFQFTRHVKKVIEPHTLAYGMMQLLAIDTSEQ
jgi:predicted unusual protein kinase regulating ubiquinone biosynthesis (AarF/ABC1/UbiB family)